MVRTDENDHSSTNLPTSDTTPSQTGKKKRHRAGKKDQSKRHRRQEREALSQTMIDDDSESIETPAFELRSVEAKGLGLFATRDIEVGERIIQEAPLFILPKSDITNSLIIESFINLQPDQQVAYLELCAHTTCIPRDETEVEKTCVAEGSVSNSTEVHTPENPGDGTGLSEEQIDRRSCASDMQSFPPKGLDSGSDGGSICKSPNADSCGGDPSFKQTYKLELPGPEATTPSPLTKQSGFDRSIVDNPFEARIWKVNGLKDALEATTTTTDPDMRSSVHDSSDDDQYQDVSAVEMTASLAARVVNIWRTNSYMLDDGINLDHAGVGMAPSRLNHSCSPNVYVAFNSTSGYMTVQTVMPVAAGDELCTAYINVTDMQRTERRALLSAWGFECTCVACADGRDESRRRKIKEIKTRVGVVKMAMMEDPTAIPAAGLEQTVGDLLDQATLMEEESLFGPDLADVCFGAARCCLILDRREEARQLQSEGLKALLRGYGLDNPICLAAFQAGDLCEA
ncbi:SET domain-containing protein [Aureobasidium subglaciale]|nr:SET domain-containing protein [Aureobasidium subglaciale]